MNIGLQLNVKDKASLEKVKSGCIVGAASDGDFITTPFYLVEAMSLKKKKGADHKSGIKEGYTPVISCGTANVACKFVKLVDQIIAKGKGEVERIPEPPCIPAGGRFTAIVYPTKIAVFEDFTKFPGLGKFVCRDSGILVIAGQIVKKITAAEAQEKYGLDLAVCSGDKEAI